MNQITGVILTTKDEKDLSTALQSISFCDESIVVVDSDIDTQFEKKIHSQFPSVTVLWRELQNGFSAQRNSALSYVKTQWCLFVDADEEIPATCQKEILSAVQSPTIDGYFLKREDILWGKHLQYGEVKNIWLLRLAKKDAGKWKGTVHETWNISGKTEKLSQPFFHHPHQSIQEFISEIDRYTTIRAQELYMSHVQSSLISIVLYPIAKFFYLYGVQQGFRDGIEGFLLSVFMSFHSFLVRAKLFLLWKRT